MKTDAVPRQENTHTADRITFQFVSGGLFSPIGLGPHDDTFNYLPQNARVGWMLSSPDPEGGVFAGNWEFILELSTSPIIEGPGNILFGPSILFRYNFVQPGWKVVPYLQAGSGFVYTDAHEDKSQRAIGGPIEFTPQGSLGMKFLVDRNWSIDVEAMYHHISNAGLEDRNLGINSVGGLIGFTYYFDNLWE